MYPLQKRWIIAIAILSLALAFRKQILENIHKATTTVETSPGKFDYYTLALSWPPAICKELDGKRCNTPVPNSDFTIHGLWPSNESWPQPEFCSPADEFDPSKVKGIKPNLTAHWPNLFVNRSSKGFWSYQWKKHGTCAGTQQLPYFNTTLWLRDNVTVLGRLDYLHYKPHPNATHNPDDIIRAYNETFKVGLRIKCVPSTSGVEMLAEIQFKINKYNKSVESFTYKKMCEGSEVLFPNE